MESISLALSGGGHPAMVFPLGVLTRLSEPGLIDGKGGSRVPGVGGLAAESRIRVPEAWAAGATDAPERAA